MAIPPNYTRSLIVLGRFRADREDEDGHGVFVFDSSDAEADGALTAAEVFGKLKPELSLKDGNSIWVDNVAYGSLALEAPQAVAGRSGMEIGLNSVLLETSQADGDNNKQLARFGGVLVRRMVQDLDIVTRFAGASFSQALRDLAHAYLTRDSFDRLDTDNLIGVEIGEIFREDPITTGRILQILTAFEADLPAARRALRTSLAEVLLRSRDEKSRNAKIDAILASVDSLRVQLEGAARDKTWTAVVGVAPHFEMPWVEDLSKGGPERYVDLGEMDRKIGASLRDAYALYRASADNLHKFVRAPSLHSYVFMWLMSKYGAMGEGDLFPLAQIVYKRGVEGAGANRRFGETPENTARRKKTAVDASRQAIKDDALRQTIKEKIGEAPDLLKGFELFAENIVSDICDVIALENRFTRSELDERLEKLFVQLAGSASGPIAEALEESRSFIRSHKKVYQKLMDVLNSAQDEDWTSEALQANVLKAGDERHLRTLEAAAATAAKSFQDLAQAEEEERRQKVRSATLDAFTQSYSHESIAHFAQRYGEKGAQIGGQLESLGKAYAAAALLSGRSVESASEAAASAGLVPAVALEPPSEEAKKAAYRKFESAIEAIAAAPKDPTRFMLPEQVAKKIGERPKAQKKIDIDLVDEKTGGSIGKLTLAEFGGEIQFEDSAAGLEGEDPLQGVKLVAPSPEILESLSGAGDGPLTLASLDPERRAQGALKEHQDRLNLRKTSQESLENLTTYGRAREDVRKLYTDPGRGGLSPEARAKFERSARALTLGEFIAAAPDGQTRIGQVTLSESLKLLIDLAETIGDRPSKNADLEKPEPDELTKEALGPLETGAGPDAALNLSAYFRLPSGPDSARAGANMIVQAIGYHRAMTRAVRNVSGYLQDLSDLKAIAEAAAGARLIVINRTLAEHVAEASEHGAPMVGQGIHAATLYLSRSSHAAGAEGEGAAWRLLGEMFQGAHEERITNNKRDDLLSCPMAISAEADAIAFCPFPVAPLGKLRQLKFRLRTAEEVKAVSDMEKGLVVEGVSTAIGLPAAMAAATILRNAGTLGRFPQETVSFPFRTAFKKQTEDLHFDASETLVDFLRRLWKRNLREKSQVNGCVAAMAVARYATLALTRDPAANPVLKQLIVAARLEDAGDGAPDDPDLKQARKALFDSAIFGVSQTPNLRLYTYDKRGRIANDPSNIRFFARTEQEAGEPVVCLEFSSGKAVEGETHIPASMRKPLAFLGV